MNISRKISLNLGLLSCLVLASVLAGCGGSKATVENNGVSAGQELMDLEAARDKGLLTEEEYQKKRQQILNR